MPEPSTGQKAKEQLFVLWDTWIERNVERISPIPAFTAARHNIARQYCNISFEMTSKFGWYWRFWYPLNSQLNSLIDWFLRHSYSFKPCTSLIWNTYLYRSRTPAPAPSTTTVTRSFAARLNFIAFIPCHFSPFSKSFSLSRNFPFSPLVTPQSLVHFFYSDSAIHRRWCRLVSFRYQKKLRSTAVVTNASRHSFVIQEKDAEGLVFLNWLNNDLYHKAIPWLGDLGNHRCFALNSYPYSDCGGVFKL